MSETCALVIFVKTPGESPVKTRLAREIGSALAAKFYELSLRATTARALALKKSNPSLVVYWAVAEANCLESRIWSTFPTVSQGDGNLGQRLAHVFEQVLKTHPAVCFMGADSPHIPTHVISENISRTMKHRSDCFQLGKTLDGGFYFFGGGLSLPREVWTSVEYSTEKTAGDLLGRLNSVGTTEALPTNFDIDTKNDLLRLARIDISAEGLLPEQNEIIAWCRSVADSFGERRV